VRGLVDRVRAMGVQVLEGTPVSAIEPRRLMTVRGTVTADRVLRATEGYTASLRGEGRTLLPIYSMMVATAPLPAAVWADIGLAARETFGDDRRMVIYGQRTLDGRLALGGRAGYRFGSKRRRTVPADDTKVQRVATLLRRLFPQLTEYPITHHWGGVLGVPRHWRPCVTFDRASGLGWAGGYVGEGVAAANLAARTLTDLVLERPSPLRELPWVNESGTIWPCVCRCSVSSPMALAARSASSTSPCSRICFVFSARFAQTPAKQSACSSSLTDSALACALDARACA